MLLCSARRRRLDASEGIARAITSFATEPAAARDALDRLRQVNARRAEAGAGEIRCGIALHAGDVMYGNVGSVRRLDFTATGPAVNEVCRLETRCKTLGVPLVLSDTAASLYGGPLESLGWYDLRGVGRAIEAFALPEHRT